MKRTFKYRLYPNKTQIQKINEQFFEARNLYNCALEHRIWLYKSFGKQINFYDQAKEIKQIRKEGLCKLTNFSVCKDVIRRLDKAFKAFYSRKKKGQKAGFPRFKSENRFKTITFPNYGNGCKLNGNKIYLQGIGDVYIQLHRVVEGKIKTVSITKKNGKYFVCFVCEVESNSLPKTNNAIGIDMGLENLIVTSNGEFIDNKRFYKSAEKKLRVLQRSVARKKKGSNKSKKAAILLAKQHEKIANKRKDYFHKLSAKIVKENDVICIEDLNIKSLASGMLAKSVNDAGWRIFFNMIAYKVENTGKHLVKVNPSGTSQQCNKCGTVVKKDLSVRWHLCPTCGESRHRDLNSALVILRLGLEILRLGTIRNALMYPVGDCIALEAD